MAYTLSTRTAMGVNSNTTFTVPAGYLISEIVLEETAGAAISGGIKIGTTSGGVDVVNALPITANSIQTIPQASYLKKVFSMTVSTTLYIQAIIAWGAASINIRVVLLEANN